MIPLDVPPKKIMIICTILKDSCLGTHSNSIAEIEEAVHQTEKDVENALEAVPLEAFNNGFHVYRYDDSCISCCSNQLASYSRVCASVRV